MITYLATATASLAALLGAAHEATAILATLGIVARSLVASKGC